MQHSGQPYQSMFESVSVRLKNGKTINIFKIDPQVEQKIEETENILGREDRIKWALRFFKKTLIEELLWEIKNNPKFLRKKSESPPTKNQSGLQRQLQLRELADADITPFQDFEPDDPVLFGESPYDSFATIDKITERIGHYLQLAEKHKDRPAAKAILELEFKKQTFGEIVSFFRRCENDMNR